MNKKLEELIAYDTDKAGVIVKTINYLNGKISDKEIVELLVYVFDGEEEGEKVMASFVNYLREKATPEEEIVKILSYVYREYENEDDEEQEEQEEEEDEEDEEEKEAYGYGVLKRLINYFTTEGLSAEEILNLILKF